jgi:hypothetical protein
MVLDPRAHWVDADDRRTCSAPTPNVELTGPRRHGALAVRPMMNQGGRAARAACRSGFG